MKKRLSKIKYENIALLLFMLLAIIQFLKANIDVPKSEYYLPLTVASLIESGEKQIEVLIAEDKWYGVTYKEDKQSVVDAIGAMIDAGLYEGI